MNILVIGSGMYVTGRGGTGPGTVLASLSEISKRIPIAKVMIVAQNPENRHLVQDKVQEINRKIGSVLSVDYETIGEDAENEIPRLNRNGSYDCALVAVPDHLHYSCAKALLQNGIHCLLVKPFTPTVKEALDLIKLQEKQQVYGAVELHKRFDESNLYAKRMLQEGALGQLLYVTIDYSQRAVLPLAVFRAWAHRSNIFQYLGVHYVDLIYFLTGFKPVRAMALGTDGLLKQSGIDTFDSVHATILWQNPACPETRFVSQFATNWIDPGTTTALSDQKYKLVGTKGRIELDQKNRGVELITEGRTPQTVNPYFSEFLFDPESGSFFNGYACRSIERFVLDVMEVKKDPSRIEFLRDHRPSFKQALVSTAVVEAVNQSLSLQGEWRPIHAGF
jgi:predicted dehydrogenase